MRICRVLFIGLLSAAGCSTTSPFATTAQRPVPIAAEVANNVANHNVGAPGRSTQSPLGAVPRQQFTQSGPNTYEQSGPNAFAYGAPKPGNPFLAGLRSTTETIGNAFTIEPRVIPAASATSLANQPVNIGADLHFQAAQVLETQQNIPGAISHYQKALERSPGDPKILVGFGRLYDRQNDLRRAQGLYVQALQVDPNNCAALNANGICYAKQGNLDAALAQLSKAAQLQPQNARYKNNIANVLADAGRLDEAYSQLVGVHGEAGAHYNLGYLLLQQGKQDLARRELNLALQANPYMDEARNVLNSMHPNSAPVRPASAGLEAPGRYSVSEPVFHAPTINQAATSPQSLPPLK